jgi:hypothetical protein
MVLSQEQLTLAGQERLYDIATFNSWLDAKMAGKEREAGLLERRFRPEYAAAFAAWLRLDPMNDPTAPAGPIFMPEYRSEKSERATELGRQAGKHFEDGVTSREKGDEYVRITVVLATVLLLTALSQRFQIRGPRVGLLSVAFVMLAVAVYWISTFPRA